MIVYTNTKVGFLKDASSGIEDLVRESVRKVLHRDIKPGSSEYESWKNSLGNAMFHVLNTPLIPDDAGIAIEYSIPRTNNRVDIVVTGRDESDTEKVVIIELKQWSQVSITEKDGVVTTHMGRGVVESTHPSYKAWSYACLLQDYNAEVFDSGIELAPCAYLHNHADDNSITNNAYSHYLERAPSFCKGDKEKLQQFIAKHVKFGDNKNLLFRIDSGEIRPSKALADSLSEMLKGNREFVLIEDQKLVFEAALQLARSATGTEKKVLVVEGGPGTGKSVVAINLLATLTAEQLNAQYVSKNAAPRDVYSAKLSGSLTKTRISNLFSSSGKFYDSEKNSFDTLIVDEAHRLNLKSGIFKNKGVNQIKEIIDASKFSIFFIDEDQRVTWHDIGRKSEIERSAIEAGASVISMKLESQFRCNGSDGYLAWIDNVLQIKETANFNLAGTDYDFKVIDSPSELRDLIFTKNEIRNKARLVAGYCWDWVSRNDAASYDIVFPGSDFQMKWNLNSDGNTWIIAPKSVKEVGCIHTCQGLEVDYIGVIIGNDLIVRDGQVITRPEMRSKHDKSLMGYKKLLKTHPEMAKIRADEIIKNTYRTLMTRGMKGCYIYSVDPETNEYFKQMM